MSKILLILNDIFNLIVKYYGGKESESPVKSGKDSKTFRRPRNIKSRTSKRKKDSDATANWNCKRNGIRKAPIIGGFFILVKTLRLGQNRS